VRDYLLKMVTQLMWRMAARIAVGYGIPVEDLKAVAMRLLRDAARNA
jgi:hypothetical protein